LGNSDLIFEANILRAKIVNMEGSPSEANRLLTQLLNMVRREREEAAVHYELREVAENRAEHIQKALELYQALYQRTPQYIYKFRIDRLVKELNSEIEQH
jgi:hypothetical protein